MKELLLFFGIFFLLIACNSNIKSSKLILKRDEKTSMIAYFDEKGNKVLGDYFAAYTDTITDFGIVADPGFVLIDKTGKHIYDIYAFDNGPDYTQEGIYRIIKNGKIGYVDSITSKILVDPKFDCGFPFENGKAKVSYKCESISEFPDEEHKTWESENWIYIDRNGNQINN